MGQVKEVVCGRSGGGCVGVVKEGVWDRLRGLCGACEGGCVGQVKGVV